MGTQVLSNALLLLDGIDLSGQANSVGIDYGVETRDDSTLKDTTRSNCGGLKTVGFSAEGFVEQSEDSVLFASAGVSDSLITVAPGRSVGDPAYSIQGLVGQYDPINGSVGDMLEFRLEGAARAALERGNLLFHSDSEGASADGASFQAGAAATQITAYLHVFSATGVLPSLDVIVESDDDSGFASPTTRLTFAQANQVDGRAQRLVSVGAVSDQHWRVGFTIGGTSPDFGFAVVLILE